MQIYSFDTVNNTISVVKSRKFMSFGSLNVRFLAISFLIGFVNGF
jgi:hypothetical protein